MQGRAAGSGARALARRRRALPRDLLRVVPETPAHVDLSAFDKNVRLCRGQAFWLALLLTVKPAQTPLYTRSEAHPVSVLYLGAVDS